jgi:anti-anti-sigma factor
MQRISIQASERGTVKVARIEGEIELTTSSDLAEALLQELSDESSGLVAELSGVSYIDSAGIRLFVDLAERMRRNGQALALALPPAAPIRRTLAIVKMELLVPVRDSVEEAVAGIASAAAD